MVVPAIDGTQIAEDKQVSRWTNEAGLKNVNEFMLLDIYFLSVPQGDDRFFIPFLVALE